MGKSLKRSIEGAIEKITAPLNQCPIAWQAQITPNLIAIETDQQTLSYLQLDQHIQHLSKQLQNSSMKKGDRLVSTSVNNLASVILLLTCLRNAFVFCPLNPKFTDTETQQRIKVLQTPFIWDQSAETGLPLNFDSYDPSARATHPFIIDPLAITNIIFTSGSSGVPKAVMHHFSNHYYSALGSQSIIPLQQGDKNLLSLPLFHISGYATVMRTMLAGATLRISENRLSALALQKHAITHLSLVNSQLQQLLTDNNFHQKKLPIKHLLLGGSAFSNDLLQTTRARGFTYHLSYGLTEMSSQVATSTNDEALQLLPYRQVKVINGEFQLCGETRFAGYFNGSIRNGLIAKDKYFLSADLGRLTNQVLSITGRKDRQFISGGENIQPEELEKVLLAFPALTRAYIVPIADKTFGQRPVAFIKWKHKEQIGALTAHVKKHLVPFKQPILYLQLPEQTGIKPDLKQLQLLASLSVG